MLVSTPKLRTLKADKRLPGSSRDTGPDGAGGRHGVRGPHEANSH